jgi:hypothetical protein
MRSRKVILIAAIGALAAFAAVYGTANTLGGIDSEQLGAGSATVASCDSNGVTTSYTLSGSDVTAVTVSGIADLCETGAISIAVTGASGTLAQRGPLTIPADGDLLDTSVEFTLASPISAGLVTGVNVVIVGSR